MRIKTIQTSNKNFILKYFRCRDGKRTETRIGMEGIGITHSCIPLYTVYMQHIPAFHCTLCTCNTFLHSTVHCVHATHSCIPLYTVYMQHIMAHSGGMQEWVIQIPSIPILVSVLFPSLHLKYFRIKFLLLVEDIGSGDIAIPELCSRQDLGAANQIRWLHVT